MEPTWRKTKVRGWNGFACTAAGIDLGVAPEIGGRVVSLRYRGEELLFVRDEFAGKTLTLPDADVRARKKRIGERLWGGDKTWVAPQSDWVDGLPPLHLDAGRYAARIDDSFLEMTSPLCTETGLRVVRRVALASDGTITLDQTLRNEGSSPARRGIWDVTQLLRPWDVFVPLAADGIRPYPEEGESVGAMTRFVTSADDWARVRCDDDTHFKYGGLAGKGAVVAMRRAGGRTLLHLRMFSTDPHAAYAHESSVEVFNSGTFNYLEVEIHAPLSTLEPGGEVTHRQVWRFALVPGEPYPDEVLSRLASRP